MNQNNLQFQCGIHLLRKGLAVVMVAFSMASAANADLITFTFSNSEDQQSVITKTVDGLTLTMSNPIGSSGNPDPFTMFNNALLLADFTAPYRFEMMFSEHIQLVSFRVDNGEFSGPATFDVIQGIHQSIGNNVALPHGETRAFTNTTTTFAGNTTIDWISTGIVDDGDAYRISHITVHVVPEPSACSWVALAAFGSFGFVRRKRRCPLA